MSWLPSLRVGAQAKVDRLAYSIGRSGVRIRRRLHRLRRVRQPRSSMRPHLPRSFVNLAWSNLAAQSAEQLSLAAAPLVAVLALGAGPGEVGLVAAAQTLHGVARIAGVPRSDRHGRLQRRRPSADTCTRTARSVCNSQLQARTRPERSIHGRTRSRGIAGFLGGGGCGVHYDRGVVDLRDISVAPVVRTTAPNAAQGASTRRDSRRCKLRMA